MAVASQPEAPAGRTWLGQPGGVYAEPFTTQLYSNYCSIARPFDDAIDEPADGHQDADGEQFRR